MTAIPERSSAATDTGMVTSRVFDAPRELVWKAWTDPQQLAQWWGPHEFTNPRCELDARPGGAIRIDMRGPDGTIYPSEGVVREAIAPERLVFTMSVMNGLFETLNTITFADLGGKTKVTVDARVTQAASGAEQFLAGMNEGWSQSFERLGEFVSNDNEIVATRLFNAPRELVWKLWTEPQHIARWWGPNGFRNTIEMMDVRPGGTWKFVMHGPDGTDYQNKVIYSEVVAPERLVYDHVSGPLFRAVVTFSDQYGKTRVNMRMRFESAALRNKVAEEFGAVEGLSQTLGRLGEEISKMSNSDEFKISRTFDAPQDLMWKVWTESDRLAQWFGPKGVKVIKSDNDLRAGGVYHYAMQTPDGGVMWGKWVYRSIEPPRRLEFVSSFSDEAGGVTRHPMAPTWPRQLLSVITFDDFGDGKTTVTVQWSPLEPTEEERTTFRNGMASMNQGWSGTMERLENYLGSL
jgi:uncharacterized protein YndB with AHSA1/START domain